MSSCGSADVNLQFVRTFAAPAPGSGAGEGRAAAAVPPEGCDENYCERYVKGLQPHRCARPYCKASGTWRPKTPATPAAGKEWRQQPGEQFEEPPDHAPANKAKASVKEAVKAKKAKRPARKATKVRRPARKAAKAKAKKKR